MFLSDWHGLPVSDRHQRIVGAINQIPAYKKQGNYKFILSLIGIKFFDEFVREIILARNAGQARYSANRIYDYLVHRYTRSRLSLIHDVRSVDLLADVSTRIFSEELTGFFDDEGIVA